MSKLPKRIPGGEISIYLAIRGGVVGKPELAIKLAELYIESAYDKDALSRQLPLIVIDEGDCWLIQGSAKYAPLEGGPAIVRIVKEDGRVLNLTIPIRIQDLMEPK